MMDCIFTIDYEIYGNGEGSFKELVYEPTERLKSLFDKWDVRFVIFVEAAELEVVEASGTDQAIYLVKDQIRELFRNGYELGLHLHPQWYNARYQNGKWELDYSEYNLCHLSRERIDQIFDRSVAYLRKLLGVADFTPLSFRAGNWLFQPTQTVAEALVKRGVKVDSSVYKGGLQHLHKLDYREALKNGYYWTFSDNVNIYDPQGALFELPTYTRMVPVWKLLTAKRIGLQKKGTRTAQPGQTRLSRLADFLRLWYPLKLDFCRMSIKELTQMLDAEIRKDRLDPVTYRPIVLIGHTKELRDMETVASLLSYMHVKNLPVSGFRDIFDKLKNTQ